MILIIISIVLFFAYAILMMAYKLGWQRQNAGFTPTRPEPVSITVIIPARNEAENIGICLQSILSNNYPKDQLEIIVIDDFSTDDTAGIAAALLSNGQGKVLQLKDFLSETERLNSYKKKALEIAISQAKGTWIVTTDADCKVLPGWLAQMASLMQEANVKFIAAPVSFTPPANKDLLYYFQSLDFMTMQGITAASVKLGLGNMCNGANLSFNKAAFDEVDGYKGIDHIASGDDMMLMYKIRTTFPDGIQYLKSKEAIVYTPAQPTWNSFLNQRIRWSSKADKYDDKILTWILALVYFFNLNFVVLFVAACLDTGYWRWFWGLLVAKIIVELLFLLPVAKFYGKRKELLLFPFLQPLHILYIILAGFLGKFGTYHWKGRIVK